MPEISAWSWAALLAAFLGMEAVAVYNRKRGDTASEVIRRVVGIKPRRWWRPLGVAGVLAFCIWLADHLIRG